MGQEIITIVGPKGDERVASRAAFEQVWEKRGWKEKGARKQKAAPAVTEQTENDTPERETPESSEKA